MAKLHRTEAKFYKEFPYKVSFCFEHTNRLEFPKSHMSETQLANWCRLPNKHYTSELHDIYLAICSHIATGNIKIVQRSDNWPLINRWQRILFISIYSKNEETHNKLICDLNERITDEWRPTENGLRHMNSDRKQVIRDTLLYGKYRFQIKLRVSHSSINDINILSANNSGEFLNWLLLLGNSVNLSTNFHNLLRLYQRNINEYGTTVLQPHGWSLAKTHTLNVEDEQTLIAVLLKLGSLKYNVTEFITNEELEHA